MACMTVKETSVILTKSRQSKTRGNKTTGIKPDCLAKPFLKWAGGKSQILNEIRAKYPKELGNTITKYAEPFVGGGAVLFDILSNYQLSEVYICDTNRELIHTYTCIRDHVDDLIGILSNLERNYINAEQQTRKNLYYDARARFNTLKAQGNKSSELAALFIFLNRTCFNGLYRVNRKGEFNVPMGDYKKPVICDENNLRAVCNKLKNVTIVCGNYAMSREFIDKNTFAYFDPPYRPLSSTSNFTSYSQDGFNDEHQTQLAQFIDELSEKGTFVVASNSDPKNADESDEFFDLLYKKHNIHRISASRMINSASDKRGKISELLIVNY